MASMFAKPEKFRIYVKRVFLEMYNIGVGSLPIVAIISIFIGAVTTVQTSYQLISGWISKTVIGMIVSDSMMLELAPTITSLVLAGKVGSHIASEIGTMRVSEQIDALEVMGINGSGFLGLPKIIAGMLMLPLLNLVAIGLGIYGGYLAGDLSGILSPETFIEGARSSFRPFNIVFSSIKSVTFAFLITSISAYQGYYTKGGALEVGKASTNAVVYSAVSILFADYILAELLL
jgi:phospholipid/cholesterol/gamma-HCH transport system permease protein